MQSALQGLRTPVAGRELRQRQQHKQQQQQTRTKVQQPHTKNSGFLYYMPMSLLNYSSALSRTFSSHVSIPGMHTMRSAYLLNVAHHHTTHIRPAMTSNTISTMIPLSPPFLPSTPVFACLCPKCVFILFSALAYLCIGTSLYRRRPKRTNEQILGPRRILMTRERRRLGLSAKAERTACRHI